LQPLQRMCYRHLARSTSPAAPNEGVALAKEVCALHPLASPLRLKSRFLCFPLHQDLGMFAVVFQPLSMYSPPFVFLVLRSSNSSHGSLSPILRRSSSQPLYFSLLTILSVIAVVKQWCVSGAINGECLIGGTLNTPAVQGYYIDVTASGISAFNNIPQRHRGKPKYAFS
jgi:hypothetical protein